MIYIPTKTISLYNTGQNLFTTPKHVVGKLTSLLIDSRDAATVITINDQFSGDVTNAVAAPTVQSSVVFQRTVYSGQQVVMEKQMLDDIRTLGAVKAYASASRDIVLVANYHFE